MMMLNLIFVIFIFVLFLAVAILEVFVTKNACLHHGHEPHLLFDGTTLAIFIDSSARPTFLHVLF